MKLNHECVRDLLLYIEENLDYGDELEINTLSLKDYSTKELLYTALKLSEANYINCDNSIEIDDEFPIVLVSSISYKGHQFLDTVRDNIVWSKTKKVVSVLKSVSLDVVSETAAKVIEHIINKSLTP